MASIGEEDLTKIAKAIGNDNKVTKLALRLGLSMADVALCRSANKDKDTGSYEGTQMLLSKWKKAADVEKQIPVLRDALCNSGLTEIADVFLPKQRKRKNGAKTEQTEKGRSKKRKLKRQELLDSATPQVPSTTNKEPQAAPVVKEEEQAALVVKEEDQAAPVVKDETPEAPAKITKPQLPPLRAASTKSVKRAPPGAPKNNEPTKKKVKVRVSLDAKKNELAEERKALKKFQKGAEKSKIAIAKLEATISKMEQTEKIQLEKSFAETKAKLEKLGGIQK